MPINTDLRNIAYQTWYSAGQNLSQAVKVLISDGYVVTRQTLAKWRDEDNWAERATRVDVAKQQVTDTVLSFEEELLRDLIKQKERYDRYFKTLSEDKVDTQAMYAYTQLCKQLKELHKELKPKGKKQSGGLKSDSIDQIKREILGMGDK